MANLQQFQSPSLRCLYASRGCTAVVRHEALLSHHEECGFAPVQCSHNECRETVNRKDLESHQQSCEFRSVTCGDCHEAMKQREYGKHPCVLVKKIDQNTQNLVEMHRILREIQAEQLRQNEENRRLAGRESGQSNTTRRQQVNLREPSISSDPFRSLAVSSISSPTAVDKQIIVAGGGDTSYEIYNWSTQQWTLHKDALFFDHRNGFSFVYEKKIMVCGGTQTNRVECLDITRSRFFSTFPAQLPGKNCGKGVLCGDKIYTFGTSISQTSLKPPFSSTVLASYDNGKKKTSYGVGCVSENIFFLVGGSKIESGRFRSTSDDALLYKPGTSYFQDQAPLPYDVAAMAVVVYKDNLVILGGRGSNNNHLNDVLMYNITSQQCHRLPSMLEKRSNCAAVIIGDTIVVIGGFSGDAYLKTAEYLVIGEETWKKLPPMHCERNGATACLLP